MDDAASVQGRERGEDVEGDRHGLRYAHGPLLQAPVERLAWVDDDPTPVESALAALKIGAILAATATIAFFYFATYGGVVIGRVTTSLTVLAAFVLPSLVAFLRTRWARRRRDPDR